MPPISPKMRWQARIDWVAFFFFSFFANFVVDIFFIGDVLMSAPPGSGRCVCDH